jgi:hypothetical protein
MVTNKVRIQLGDIKVNSVAMPGAAVELCASALGGSIHPVVGIEFVDQMAAEARVILGTVLLRDYGTLRPGDHWPAQCGGRANL